MFDSQTGTLVMDLTLRIGAALAVVVVSYLLGKRLAALLVRLLARAHLSPLHASFFRALAKWLVVFIGGIIALNLLGLERVALSLMAGGGVTAVVLGFAFREIGENLLAGLFLAFSRPFSVGDVIRSEEVEGEVREIELRYTHIRSDDGRDIFVPSSQLFNRPLTNFTRDGLLRTEFTVGIDYGDDALDACARLRAAVGGVDGVLAEPAPVALIQALGDGWVTLTVSYWRDTFDRSRPGVTVRNAALDACRRTLLDGGFTVSAGTTSNIVVRQAT